MLGRSRKKRQGSTGSIDMLSAAVNQQQPTSSSETSSSAPSRGVYNFILDRARGAVNFGGERLRTRSSASEDGIHLSSSPTDHPGTVKHLFAGQSAAGATTTSQKSRAGLSHIVEGGIPFSTSGQEIPAPSKAATGVLGGPLFRRAQAMSNPTRPGWLNAGRGPSPLTTSPSTPAGLSAAAGAEQRRKTSAEKASVYSESGKKPAFLSRSSTDLGTFLQPAVTNNFSRSVDDVSRLDRQQPSEVARPTPTHSAGTTNELLPQTENSPATCSDSRTIRKQRSTSLSPSVAPSDFLSTSAPTSRSRTPSSSSQSIPFPTSTSNPELNLAPTSSPTALVRDLRRDSQVIMCEGFLQRKVDYAPPSSPKPPPSTFTPHAHNLSSNHSSSASTHPSTHSPSPRRTKSDVNLQKGWKPYRAVLKGSKLYLHKVPGDLSSTAKQLFPIGIIEEAAAVSPAPNVAARTIFDGGAGTPIDDGTKRKVRAFWGTGASSHPGLFTSGEGRGKEREIATGGTLESLYHELVFRTTFTGRMAVSPPFPLPSPSPLALQTLLEWSPLTKPYLVLSLSGVEVRPYDNSQRSFIFELGTEDGHRSLLQASSFSEQQMWISSFRRSGTQIALRRATFLAQSPLAEEGEEAVAAAKTVTLQHTPTSTAVFGVPLHVLVARENTTVPDFVEKALRIVEERGLTEVGIYRISGENRLILKTKEQLDRGDEPNSLLHFDVHNVSGLVKMFLRELPDPLIPFNFYDAFLHANSIDNYDERLYALRDLIWKLPAPNFLLMRRLTEHLDRVSDNEDVNAMHAGNLAIIFAPTLLRAPPGPASFGLSMINLGKAANIIKSLILRSAWLFGEELDPQAVEAEFEPPIDPAEVTPTYHAEEDVALAVLNDPPESCRGERLETEDCVAEQSDAASDQPVVDHLSSPDASKVPTILPTDNAPPVAKSPRPINFPSSLPNEPSCDHPPSPPNFTSLALSLPSPLTDSFAFPS
ncbi:hypothetical protein P7C70_g1051, partial [Phenoliferia sp. Uapishka_3]